jgi:predicted anti-sigma-YlaC factor YlaD
MDCALCREVLSAEMDGEAVATAPASAHVRGCASCRTWRARAEQVTRLVRLGVAEPVPDLTAQVLATVRAPSPDGGSWRPRRPSRERAVRTGLVVVALAQLALAAPDLLVRVGRHDGPVVHGTHELGAWSVALAVGLLYAGLRPAAATGLLPVVATLLLSLLATSFADLVSGEVAWAHEAPHLLTAGGAALLWRLVVLHRPPGADVRQRGPGDGRRADGASSPAAVGVGGSASHDRAPSVSWSPGREPAA